MGYHHCFIVSLSEWLAHSKTCPQCREKCANKSVIKLYLDSCASEEDRDLTSLDSDELKVWNYSYTVNKCISLNFTERTKFSEAVKEGTGYVI